MSGERAYATNRDTSAAPGILGGDKAGCGNLRSPEPEGFLRKPLSLKEMEYL